MISEQNLMGGGGFEPPKQFAADLQSVPFGHSGIHPFMSEMFLTRIEYSTLFPCAQVIFIVFYNLFFNLIPTLQVLHITLSHNK